MALVSATSNRGLTVRYVNLMRSSFYPGTSYGAYSGYMPNLRTRPPYSGQYANGAQPAGLICGLDDGELLHPAQMFSIEGWGWEVTKTEDPANMGHDPAWIDPNTPWVYAPYVPAVYAAIRQGAGAEQYIYSGSSGANGWVAGVFEADMLGTPHPMPYTGATYQIDGPNAPDAYWTGRALWPNGTYAGIFGRQLYFSHSTYLQPGTTYTIRIRAGRGCSTPDNGDTNPAIPYSDESFTFTTDSALPSLVVPSSMAWSEPGYLAPLIPNLYVPPVNNPPVVSNVAPAVGTALAPSDRVTFDVTDDSGVFRRIQLKAEYFSGAVLALRELIWDGATFDPRFLGSTVTAIAGGWHFDLVRSGGWPSAPSVTPYAIDQLGLENA